MPTAQYKMVPIRGLTGAFDVRSLPDETGISNFRLVKNMSVRAPGKRCRRGGWTRLFDSTSYNNADLHDQLITLQSYYSSYSITAVSGGEFDHLYYPYYWPDVLSPFAAGYPYGEPSAVYDPLSYYPYDYCGLNELIRGGCNEAITYLAEFRSPRDFRKLVAGTKSRLYSLNERGGNWKLLSDGLGGIVTPENDCENCSQRRLISAQMDAVLLLTNGFDPPMYWVFDDSPSGCNLWSVKVIEDFQDLNITKAGCVAVHRGFVFWADLEQDGEYFPNKVVWSDFKGPISYLPTSDSLAGFQELGGGGERILNMAPLGDYLYIYTDQAIHRCALVASEELFNFEQLYRGQDAMRFKHSLINTGEEHFYLAGDKLMTVNLGDATPQELQWARPTSTIIFDGITSENATYGPVNREMCDLVTGGYNAVTKELIWSWPTDDNKCPNVSLILNLTRHQNAADLVDHGFTAFCLYESDELISIIDWLVELGVCTLSELLALLVKEGTPTVDSIPGTPPSCIWNETEDVDLPRSDTSLCSMLLTTYLEDICRTCPGARKFILASAQDYCLKESRDDVYSREMLDSSRTVYTQEPYQSVLESGAENFKTENEKSVSKFTVSYKAEAQTVPNILTLDIAAGAEANCMIWSRIKDVSPDGTVNPGVELRCLTDSSLADHAANQTRPGTDANFSVAVRGKYIAYRLTIDGTGGGSCFSQVTLNVAQAEFS